METGCPATSSRCRPARSPRLLRRKVLSRSSRPRGHRWRCMSPSARRATWPERRFSRIATETAWTDCRCGLARTMVSPAPSPPRFRKNPDLESPASTACRTDVYRLGGHAGRLRGLRLLLRCQRRPGSRHLRRHDPVAVTRSDFRRGHYLRLVRDPHGGATGGRQLVARAACGRMPRRDCHQRIPL